jgi:hypothetical protein
MTSSSIIVSVTAGDLKWLTRSDIKLAPPRAIGFCQLFRYHRVSVLLHNCVHNKFCVHTARSTMSARQLRTAVAIILHTDSVSMTAYMDRMDKMDNIFCHLLHQNCVCTQVNNRTNRCNNNYMYISWIKSNQSQHVSGIIMPIIRRTRTRLVKTSCEDAWFCWLWLCGAVVYAVCTFWRLLFNGHRYLNLCMYCTIFQEKWIFDINIHLTDLNL